MKFKELVTAPRVGRFTSDSPEQEKEIRDNKPNLYKSFLLTRILVGAVGVTLPIFILTWDLVADVYRGELDGPYGSLSAYYHYPTPLRDWFVGSLWAIGVGLMVYMGIRKSSLGNVFSLILGGAAICVALFPTNKGEEASTIISNMHFVFAAILIVGLGCLCVGFGRLDRDRIDDGTTGDQRRKSRFWIHWVAAGVIGFAVALVLLDMLFHFGKYSVLIAEVVAVWAFAVSWFMKGWELLEYSRVAEAEEGTEETAVASGSISGSQEVPQTP